MNVILLISHIKSEEKIPMDQETFTATVSHLISTIWLNSYSLKFDDRSLSLAALDKLDSDVTVKYNRWTINRVKTYRY